jgi:hypothetical protein
MEKSMVSVLVVANAGGGSPLPCGVSIPPNDGNSLSLDGGDGKVDGTDARSAVNMPQCVAAAEITAAASPQQTATGDPPLHVWRRELIAAAIDTIVHDAPMDCRPEAIFHYYAASLCAVEQAHTEIQWRLATFEDNVYNSFDNLLQKIDAAWTENTALREAYRASREETAALNAAVDTLMKRIDETITTTMPPSWDTVTSSTTMEEMTMQLSVVQHDIQDVLEAVRNPPGKRKWCTSNQDAKPTTLTNQRLATNKQRDASPDHSLMHSQHATCAAQDALDALMRKYPACPLLITSTEATTDPLPDSSAVQDITIADAATTTAQVENDGWKTVKGKAAQKKRRNDKADNKRAATTASNTPRTTNGGRGKNTHQPRMTTPSAKKTWAEVVKSRGINVQIVLGNGNLGLTTPMTRRGERRGGAARRLAKKEENGERGVKGRGNEGPEVVTRGGNKGGQQEKHGRRRVEERGEPGAAAPVQVGHLDQQMRGWLWAWRYWGFRPHNLRPVLGQSPAGARCNVWLLSFNSVKFAITLRLQALMRK